MLRQYFKLKYYLLLTSLLVLEMNYCEFNTDVNPDFYTNASVVHNFRLRDFAPRYALRTDWDRVFQSKRNARGFQFYADNRDFNVDLEFIVPFISIPIDKSVSVTQTAFRSLFNLNVQSLLTTGAIVAIGGVFAVILKIIFMQYGYVNDYRKALRREDGYQHDAINKTQPEYISNLIKVVTMLESKLQENHINISHCVQASLCTYAQQNFSNGGWSRILDGIFSLDVVHNYLNGTAVKDALDAARGGDNCHKIFADCNGLFPLVLKLISDNSSSLNKIMSHFLTYT